MQTQILTLGSLFFLFYHLSISQVTLFILFRSPSFSFTFDPFWYYVMPHRIIHSVNHLMAYTYKTKEVKCNANITKRNETIYDGKLFDGINSFFLNTVQCSQNAFLVWLPNHFLTVSYVRISNDLYDWHVHTIFQAKDIFNAQNWRTVMTMQPSPHHHQLM